MTVATRQDVRLEDLGLIGDGRGAGLVSAHGSLEWWCAPRFDSAPLVDGLLGGRGRWSLRPEGGATPRPARRGDGLVLETTWTGEQGVVRVLDVMPHGAPGSAVVRVVRCESGRATVRSRFVPAHRIGGDDVPEPRLLEEGACWSIGREELTFQGPGAVERDRGGGVESLVDLLQGDSAAFALHHHGEDATPWWSQDRLTAIPLEQEREWEAWSAAGTYSGPHRELVAGSLAVIKGLIFEPTGAILAAPTTSVPEDLGGVRNWDYRYAWLRDSTYAMRALTDTGHRKEAQRWRDWLVGAVGRSGSGLPVYFDVDGTEPHRHEHELDLPGYAGSQPVRVGNAAGRQFQLDVYGEVVSALHHARRAGIPDSPDTWPLEAELAREVARCWDQPDQGIWETRSDPRHYTHSQVLAWVALDRAVRDAQLQDACADEVAGWIRTRDRIRERVLARGVDPLRGTFVRAYGSRSVDAALLRIPIVGFVAWDDPRVAATVDRVRAELGEADGFVRRYDGDDGVPGTDHAFLACSFWLVECLARMGRQEEGRAAFEAVVDRAGAFGLLSEEYDTNRHRLVGNVPQVFSHVGLVVAALSLADPS